ncbi:hypothetical protein CHUAL_002390 [Chamberlinius hualienensis]
MPGQNGVTNGVNSTNHRATDDFDSISGTSPKMIMLDETATLNGRHDSVDGRDNPAFEGEHDQAQGNGKTNGTKINGTNGTNGHHSPKSSEKAETDGKLNGDNVEMVPLNPTAANNYKNHQQNHGKSTNGSSKPTTKDGKTPLDMTNSDYFRPVNNKRKLFRGQKLYVTSDQRSDSRRWKWIAFWGGVFTFVAAALLTGILAATGIIMSKSNPSYGPPNAVYRNESFNESVSGSIDEWNSSYSNATTAHTTKLPATVTSETVSQQEISPVTFDNHTNVNDSVTLEDRPHLFTEHQTVPTVSVTNVPDHTMSQAFPTNITSVTFAVIPTVVTSTVKSEISEQSADVPTVDDRGRSLDKVVPIVSVDNVTSESEPIVTVAPVESETLFPALENVPTEEDNTTMSFTPAVPQPTTFQLEPTLFNETDLANVSFITELPSPTVSVVEMPKSENATDSSQSNIFDDLPSVITNNTTDLWNNSLIDEITDLLYELDSNKGNDSFSTNETNVAVATEESKTNANTTELSVVANVTDNILPVSDNFTHADKEESHFNVNKSLTATTVSLLDNTTVAESTTEVTSTPHSPIIATANDNSSLSVEAKSLDANSSIIVENGTVVSQNSDGEASQGPTNGTTLVAPTLASNTMTTLALEITNSTDASILTITNVTDAASIDSSSVKVTVTSPVPILDVSPTNTTLEFTTLESENNTDTTSL